jgi:polyisoprenoid-binding protein YceI
MKKLFTLLALTLGLSLSAQQYMTRQGSLTFDAGSPLEDIVATSNSATAVYDAQDGKLGVQVLMTSFEFKRALMQEHFNENYAESEVYPKAVFKGKFEAGRAIGALTIHGVTKDVDVPAKLDLSKETAHLVAEFAVTIEEYGIAIPSAVANKIDKQAKILVDCKLVAK